MKRVQKINNIIFSKMSLSAKIKSLGRSISRDYKDQELTIISLMAGSILFTADLIREISIPIHLYTITVSSYNGAKISSGILNIKESLPNCKDKNILLVDDILDSGLTLSTLKANIEELKPNSVKTCVLLKKNIERNYNIEPDYYGFNIGEEFVVGYGLDYQGLYRYVPYIVTLEDK